MDSFTRFIPDGTELDAGAIRGAGLAALPFPEWASPDEIVAVGRLAGAERAELWSCQHQQQPHHLARLSLDEAGRQSFDLGYANVLVAFESAETYVWQPLDHEFFVVFAPPPVLETIRLAGLFIHDFHAYAREDYFKGARSEYLVEMESRYTVVPS